MKPDPLIKLDPSGRAPVVSYNVPEPTSYSGTTLTELTFPAEWFRVPPGKGPDVSKITLDEVVKAMRDGFEDPIIFPLVNLTNARLYYVPFPIEIPPPGVYTNFVGGVSQNLQNLTPTDVLAKLQETPPSFLNVYVNLFGQLDYMWSPIRTRQRPRLIIVQDFRLSSFLGTYGAGRTINTFTLLPGEKTRISIRSYSKQSQDTKNATSILDSFTEESSKDFENSVQSEQSDKRSTSDNLSWYVDASASVNWGVFKAEAKAGAKGAKSSADETFAKNISHATEKHAAKASAKRDIQINTTSTTTTETGTETTIEREIQNINVSRTLNFVFRQMNQEFISLLHLVDARVGYFDGLPDTKREVALHQLDSLIDEFIKESVTEADGSTTHPRAQVRQAVIDNLQYIYDYRDEPIEFLERRVIPKDTGPSSNPGDPGPEDFVYWRVRKGTKDSNGVWQPFVSIYEDETNNKFSVPGVILSANKYVLRTDGVIVDAILGVGEALDAYSHGLQDEAVRARKLANDVIRDQLKREELGQLIVARKDSDEAKVFADVFFPPDSDGAEEDGEVFPPANS